MHIQFNSSPVDAPLRITSNFGPRDTGIKGASKFHKGVDIGRDFNKKETRILAVANGTVIHNYWNNARGWVIIINHGDFKTLYQHLKEKSPLYVGSKIEAGVPIGLMGSSSKTLENMAIHLHFELIINDLSIDPEPYLKKANKNNNLEKNAIKRYKTIKEIPKALQSNIQILLDYGALQGIEENNLDITEDMARVLVINMRYIDKLYEKQKWNQQS